MSRSPSTSDTALQRATQHLLGRGPRGEDWQTGFRAKRSVTLGTGIANDGSLVPRPGSFDRVEIIRVERRIQVKPPPRGGVNLRPRLDPTRPPRSPHCPHAAARLSQCPSRVPPTHAANPSLPGLLAAGGTPAYERHRPEETRLHTVVREQLESFLAHARDREHPVPRFVEQELRAYLRCGILAHGFLRLHCDACGHDRLVAFSCKRRGFCPSCGGRRMADTAAHLVDCVLPEVPIRQWVLMLPYPLRYRCAYDRALTSQVLRAFLRTLFAALRRRAKDQWNVPHGQCGAVTFIQRFGSALNLNLHFHTLALDGVYVGDYGTPLRFLPLPPPNPDEVARVLAGTARRTARLLEARAEADDDALTRDEPLLATLAAASLRARTALGPDAGQRWRRLGERVEPREADSDPEASPRVPQHGGMSLHADVAVPARDRQRLERLCRYVARPPLAHDRLEDWSDGRLALRLKARWRDGTTHILMQRHELLERLVPLIPPPRAHQVRYHGVLAPCASARKHVVPGPRLPAECSGPAGPEANAPILTPSPEPDGVRAQPPTAQLCTDADAPADPSSANVANGPETLGAALPGDPPTDSAIGRQRALPPTPPPTARAHAASRGPHFSSGSSRWMRCAAPAAAAACAWSQPSRIPQWPARSSPASISRHEHRRSEPRRTSRPGSNSATPPKPGPTTPGGASTRHHPTATARHSTGARRGARQHTPASPQGMRPYLDPVHDSCTRRPALPGTHANEPAAPRRPAQPSR